MTPATKLENLNQWQRAHTELQEHYDDMDKIFSISPESKAATTIWDSFMAYTKCVALLLGDKGEWLEWYWLENDMGKKGHTAGDGAKPETVKPVKNLSDLLEFIEKQ